jgi:hypothetical protein
MVTFSLTPCHDNHNAATPKHMEYWVMYRVGLDSVLGKLKHA